LESGLERDIIRAAKKGDCDRIMALLNADPALVHSADTEGCTPLHCAAWKGNYDAVSTLIDYGSDINALSNNTHYGGTPLHAAAHGNHREIAEFLISHGADTDAVSCNERTPLQETEIHKATAVAKVMRKAVGV
jgi:ankyrin repeat protein